MGRLTSGFADESVLWDPGSGEIRTSIQTLVGTLAVCLGSRVLHWEHGTRESRRHGVPCDRFAAGLSVTVSTRVQLDCAQVTRKLVGVNNHDVSIYICTGM